MISIEYLEAGDPYTPPLKLCALANHPSESIRIKVSENTATPFFILLRLANDEHADVRSGVANNPKAQRLLELLVEDRSPDVRFSLAENPHLPQRILRKLVEDDNPHVSDRARRTLARLDDSRIVEAPVKTWTRRNVS